jgi:hypothetical protein
MTEETKISSVSRTAKTVCEADDAGLDGNLHLLKRADLFEDFRDTVFDLAIGGARPVHDDLRIGIFRSAGGDAREEREENGKPNEGIDETAWHRSVP